MHAQRVKPNSNDLFFFSFDLKQIQKPDLKEKLIITKNQKPVLKSVFVALKHTYTNTNTFLCKKIKSVKPRKAYEDRVNKTQCIFAIA